MLHKQKTRAWLLSLAALVLLLSNYFVGWAVEPDPRILWVADSSMGRIDGFAVHPNGNIFAYNGSIIFEIDGSNGKLIRILPKFSEKVKISSIDISDDGKYLATSYDGVTIIDLSDLSSKTFGNGNRVTFVPNSNKIAYRASTNPPETTGHDSSIVILDLTTQERSYIKTEELIHKISFSPDGRFFATGGTGKLYGNFYTSLKLWDAKTLKLIKELDRFDNDYQIPKIEFSPSSKMIAFFGNMGLPIFSTETYTKIKEYTKSSLGVEISRFSYINDEFIGIQSKKTSIMRLSDDHRIDLIEFPYRGFLMESSSNKKILFAGTGYLIESGSLIAWDLEKVFSNVENPVEQITIGAEYQKGIILISGINVTNNSVNLEIFDINGKLIHQLKVELNGTELRIPIVLVKGTYLLNLTDGNKKYSSKFLVTE